MVTMMLTSVMVLMTVSLMMIVPVTKLGPVVIFAVIVRVLDNNF